jgi:hypothetical protein
MGVIAVSKPSIKKTFKDVTLNVNNTTGSIATFTVTGTVQVYAFWGIVTTQFSSNITDVHLRLNDQTATVDMTLATGATMSNMAVGALLIKDSDGAVDPLTGINSTAGAFGDSGGQGVPNAMPFFVQKKTGATTTIDFRYTTTNTPSTGAVRFWAVWEALSDDGALS